MNSTHWKRLTLAAATACGMMALPLQAATPEASTTPPAATQPATEPSAKITPKAQKALDAIGDAYGKLDSLKMSGELELNVDVNGQKQNQKVPFQSSYKSPNQFRHEMSDELLVGSTGKQAYLYDEKGNQYFQADMPAQKVPAEQMPVFIARMLSRQNPSLMLALSPDAAAALTHDAVSIQTLPDVKLGDETYNALEVKTERGAERLLVNPKTHLLRQVKLDFSEPLRKQGAPNVKQAELTFNYTTVEQNPSISGDQFAWTPPANAKDLAKQQPESPALSLENNAAPDFTLDTLKGDKETLSKMKGSVVVLDFWATWCPPCRESLPHLDSLYKELSPKGVKVYAVNLQEEKPKVQKYIDDNKLTFPVLLDTDGKVATEYKAQAIPQTVVVGKDGKVKKVFVGFGPTTAKDLQQAVEAAMKE